jgi:hypothetical protein
MRRWQGVGYVLERASPELRLQQIRRADVTSRSVGLLLA